MKVKELNFDKLAEYINDIYGNDVRSLATELRKLAIDYGRVNSIIGVSGESYISTGSHEYLVTLNYIADALDQSI